jgi:copper oxidase (laccase) domain-containing protein
MQTDYLSPLLLPQITVDFVPRLAGVEMDCDRDEAMKRLRDRHSNHVSSLGFSQQQWWRAEQVHGNQVAIAGASATITATDGLPLVPGVDGLVTNQSGILLAIYVADCGAIWLADRVTGAIGLLHSGKKGTEGNILGVAVATMVAEFGSRPEDIVGVLGPCIRVPEYDVDFAATIRQQAIEAEIGEFYDSQICTASDLSSYYSYRKELGRTGRMMALIGKK